MSLADWKADTRVAANNPPMISGGEQPPALHRIAQVRQQQGVSLRSAARRMRMDASEVKVLENPASDMPLSTLYKWQKALDVPITHLLVDEDEPLSTPVMKRARLIRLMKTAAAIQEAAKNDQVKRMATMLIEQLVEIMPELKEVGAWHTVGQRRSLDDVGRAAERVLPDDWFCSPGC